MEMKKDGADPATVQPSEHPSLHPVPGQFGCYRNSREIIPECNMSDCDLPFPLPYNSPPFVQLMSSLQTSIIVLLSLVK